MPTGATTSIDVLWIALAVFLVLAGLGLAYALLRLGLAFGQLSRTVRRAENEVLPVVAKAGGTLDRVNRELDSINEVTDRAVSAVRAAEGAVRSLSRALSGPAQKLAAAAAGVRYGVSSFLAHHDLDEAVRAAREAAARREADLAAEMEESEGRPGQGPPFPPAA